MRLEVIEAIEVVEAVEIIEAAEVLRPLNSPVLKKVALAGLNSLQQQGYQILVKNLIFDDPFHKKGQVLVILVPGMIQPSWSEIFLMK